MSVPAFYELLLHSIGHDVTVQKMIHGVAWTSAVLSDGRCAVAMHTEGETRPRLFSSLIGMTAREAAEAVLSWNMEEASEGMAVINAYYNTADRLSLYSVPSVDATLDGIDLSGKTIGFIGHLISHGGITEEVVAPARQVYIIEREPRLGDYPDTACEYLLPLCDTVVITGSAAVNKTMPRLLELSRHAEVFITGPSVPLCPELLDLGIRRLCGMVITDPDAMLNAIVEKRQSINPWSIRFALE